MLAGGDGDIYVVRTDGNGNTVWDRPMHPPARQHHWFGKTDGMLPYPGDDLATRYYYISHGHFVQLLGEYHV